MRHNQSGFTLFELILGIALLVGWAAGAWLFVLICRALIKFIG